MSPENSHVLSAYQQPTAAEQMLLEIDPNAIDLGKAPNREDPANSDADFSELVRSIRAAGRNVTPVKVRLVPNSTPAKYELVYGHRRVQVCKHLRLKVAAIVEPWLSDEQLLVQRVSENMARVPFRPIELGRLAIYSVETGMYKSLRAFAVAVDADIGLVSKGATLAQLPSRVLAALPSVLELQYKHAKPLSDALKKDPHGVEARAECLRQLDAKPTTSVAIKMLLGTAPEATVEPFNSVLPVMVEGVEVGRIEVGGRSLKLDFSNDIPPAHLDRLVCSFQAWLQAKLRPGKSRRKSKAHATSTGS